MCTQVVEDELIKYHMQTIVEVSDIPTDIYRYTPWFNDRQWYTTSYDYLNWLVIDGDSEIDYHQLQIDF